MKDTDPREQPSPFIVFAHWFHEHSTRTSSKYPGACVLSSVGTDGVPNARFISLKVLEYPYLIFGSPLRSRKAIEIKENHNVALTFWWEDSMRQVRIQGIASETDENTSDLLFGDRKKEARVVSLVSEQGAALPSWEILRERYRTMFEELSDEKIERPDHWGGFKVEPFRFEFMEFRETRLHYRQVFSKKEGGWEMNLIQP